MSMAASRTMGEAGGQVTEKVTESPGAAPDTTAGRDPGPELLQLLTTSSAAPATDGRTVTEKAATAVAMATAPRPRGRGKRTPSDMSHPAVALSYGSELAKR
jgi:hypothetical protein